MYLGRFECWKCRSEVQDIDRATTNISPDIVAVNWTKEIPPAHQRPLNITTHTPSFNFPVTHSPRPYPSTAS